MLDRHGILLIGHGFLGGALARSLASSGRIVHVLSPNSNAGQRGQIMFHRGSQDAPDTVARLLADCHTVVHLASRTNPGSSARRAAMEAEENLLPVARLLEVMSASPPDRLLFISTGGAIYGNPRVLPVDESVAPDPLSYYAAGKVALESLFTAFANAHSTSLAIVRPSNLYGPGQSLLGGFGLVRTLLERALRGEVVEMWGDGGNVRDYLFIDDVADACRRLVDATDLTGTFNAGSGEGTSIVELIDLVHTVTGCNLAVTTRPARSTDVRAIVLDSTRLRKAAGWTPHVDLATGLARTWAWLCEREK